MRSLPLGTLFSMIWEKRSTDKNIETYCMEHLLEQDDQMKGFALMSDDERKREQGFLINSIRGFLGFLSD